MASLLVAGSIFIHNKIKDKKEARREKKRQSYEDRYNELQREHSLHEEKSLQRQESGARSASQQPPSYDDAVAVAAKGEVRRRESTGSLKSTESDGPSRWVDETVQSRQKVK